MADLVINALRRKLRVAQRAGDEASIRALKERLAEAEPAPAAAPPAEPEPEPEEGLDVVAFASPEAFEAAEAAGLTASDFAGRAQSGKTGFTKADVADITGPADD